MNGLKLIDSNLLPLCCINQRPCIVRSSFHHVFVSASWFREREGRKPHTS